MGLYLVLQNPAPTSLPKAPFPAYPIALTALHVDGVLSTFSAQTPFPRSFGPNEEHVTGYKHRTILFAHASFNSPAFSPPFLPQEETSGKSHSCLLATIHLLPNIIEHLPCPTLHQCSNEQNRQQNTTKQPCSPRRAYIPGAREAIHSETTECNSWSGEQLGKWGYHFSQVGRACLSQDRKEAGCVDTSDKCIPGRAGAGARCWAVHACAWTPGSLTASLRVGEGWQ